jgi:hypothetical protein
MIVMAQAIVSPLSKLIEVAQPDIRAAALQLVWYVSN